MVLEFTSERNKDLKAAERTVLERLGDNASYTSRKRILELVLLEPAPRFYVSQEEARKMIGKLICGLPCTRLGLHRNLYTELFLVFKRLSLELPEADRTTLITKAINSPASGFFLTRRTVEEYLNRIK